MQRFRITETSDGWNCVCVQPDGRTFESGRIGDVRGAFTTCAERLRGSGVDDDEFEVVVGAAEKGICGDWGTSIDAEIGNGRFSLAKRLSEGCCELWHGESDRPLGPIPEICVLLDKYAPGWTFEPQQIGYLVATDSGPARELPYDALPCIMFVREEDMVLATAALPAGALS
jgi:hypothetical protein